jgi:hypothetical protein
MTTATMSPLRFLACVGLFAVLCVPAAFAFDQEPVQTAAKDGLKGPVKTLIDEDCKYVLEGDKWQVRECDREVYSYDTLGNKTEYRRYSDKGELRDIMQYKYKNGRLAEVLDLSPDGGLDERQVFIYGNDGALVECRELDDKGVMQKRFTNYKTDAAGNVLQYIGTRLTGFRVNEKERDLKMRKIEYYGGAGK